MTVHPTIENMGCNLCLVIMQSRSEKPVLSSNIMSLFPNSGHENKHYLQFSTTISSTESTSYLFVDFFFCVWSFPVFLSVFPHLSGIWYFRHRFELLFLATFPPCVFRRFFQSSTLRCREHDMLHYCTFFDRGKRIEHCQQGMTRSLNPVILHLFSIIITIKTQMKNTS